MDAYWSKVPYVKTPPKSRETRRLGLVWDLDTYNSFKAWVCTTGCEWGCLSLSCRITVMNRSASQEHNMFIPPIQQWNASMRCLMSDISCSKGKMKHGHRQIFTPNTGTICFSNAAYLTQQKCSTLKEYILEWQGLKHTAKSAASCSPQSLRWV